MANRLNKFESRYEIFLLTHPRIQADLLQAESDRKTMITGVRMAREVLGQPTIKDYCGEEVASGPKRPNNEELLAYIRTTTLTAHQLRVRGLEKLRVIDASVMPELVCGSINACVLMIAERGAHFVRDDPPHATDLPPAAIAI